VKRALIAAACIAAWMAFYTAAALAIAAVGARP
jgi:hypothetical protein